MNIKKATLRHWRSEFARNLRLLGVEANGTERAVRGETKKAKKDGIHRASQRGDSTYVRAQAEAVAAELLKEESRVEPGKRNQMEIRRAVEGGWRSISNRLAKEGQDDLAKDVQRFVERMPAPTADRERIAGQLLERVREPRDRDQQLIH